MNYYDYVERKDLAADAETERVAHEVIGAAIEVHSALGPGLPESVYLKALSHELTLRGIPHVVQYPVPIVYKGLEVGEGRVDLFVADRLVVELKSVETLSPVHRAQVIAYLQALNLRLGLLINFNVAVLKDGLKRVLNPHYKPPTQ